MNLIRFPRLKLAPPAGAPRTPPSSAPREEQDLPLRDLWLRTMGAAESAFRDGDRDTGTAKLAYACWLAALSGEGLAKADADGAYRRVVEAAGCFGEGDAA